MYLKNWEVTLQFSWEYFLLDYHERNKVKCFPIEIQDIRDS